MLSEEVKDYSVDDSPESAPHFWKCVCNSDQDSIWGNHHDTADDIDDEKDKQNLCWLILVFLHKVVDLISVEVLEQADKEANVANDYYGQDVNAKAVRVGCGI